MTTRAGAREKRERESLEYRDSEDPLTTLLSLTVGTSVCVMVKSREREITAHHGTLHSTIDCFGTIKMTTPNGVITLPGRNEAIYAVQVE